MSGGFKRSGRFGLIGVVVVAVLVAVIASTTDQGETSPKLTMALVFGVIAVFVVVLLLLQRSDLERAASGGSAAASRAAAEGGRRIDNPMTTAEPDLWGAMATAPIDADAVRAREEMWDVGRRSLHLGMVVCALIFLTVPTMYLTESIVPLLIGAPLIVLVAIYGAVRAIGPGGEIQSGYERTDRAMKPLGLQVTERPKGGFETREPVMHGFDYRLRGWTVMSGERHGRGVSVRLGGSEDAGTSEVTVAVPQPRWSARSRDGRVRATPEAPAGVMGVLEAVPGSARWKRVEVEAGPEGILVRRKKGTQADWLCDLWLAERLADA